MLSAHAAKSASTMASMTASNGASSCINPIGFSFGMLTGRRSDRPLRAFGDVDSEARRWGDCKPLPDEETVRIGLSPRCLLVAGARLTTAQSDRQC